MKHIEGYTIDDLVHSGTKVGVRIRRGRQAVAVYHPSATAEDCQPQPELPASPPERRLVPVIQNQATHNESRSQEADLGMDP